MNSSGSVAGGSGLFGQLVLPFSVFVLTASVAMVMWIEASHRRESLRQFVETARVNAQFVETLRLPRSSELGKHLTTILGVEVGFIRVGETVSGLPRELRSVLDSWDGKEAKVWQISDWDLAVAPLKNEPLALVLTRPSAAIALKSSTWVLPSLIVTILGGGLALWVARRIVHPLTILTRWLPNLDRPTPEALPLEVTRRADEIGKLGRSLEENAQRLREEIGLRRQSERLAALGRITTSLAHEIRNPAAAIRFHADLLATLQDAESDPSLDLIREEVDQITDLVNQWLFVAQPSPPQLERRDLASMIRGVLERLSPQLDHAGVRVSCTVSAPAMIAADTSRIEQVLRNLFLNAMQAMPDGGTIEIHLSEESARWKLEIRDEGRGFREEALTRWQEPFFSQREGGMGLGLTLAAEVIDGHGGTLEIENLPKRGACVCVCLPQWSEPPLGS